MYRVGVVRMTKMDAIPIYGENLQKCSSSKPKIVRSLNSALKKKMYK